jgi:hypothetical protein
LSAKEKPPSGAGVEKLLEELLGEEEEPTRHVKFEVPPGGKPVIVEDLTGEAGPVSAPTTSNSDSSSGPGAIFDNLELGPEVSLEIPVHQLTFRNAEPPPAGRDKASTPIPANRFARGFTAGRLPLDGSEFTEDKKPAKKKTPQASRLPPSTTPPMEENLKLKRTGFFRRITFRDVVLLLLVFLLAASLWIAWNIFEKLNTRQEMRRLEAQRQELEKKKTEVFRQKQGR